MSPDTKCPATEATGQGRHLANWTTMAHHDVVGNSSERPQATRWHACAAAPKRLDFAAVNAATRRHLPDILARWLPDGRRIGREYVARNPTRRDRRLGSFKINLVTGHWADFATGDKGGDPVSLAAYLFGLSQSEAARRLADMLGVR